MQFRHAILAGAAVAALAAPGARAADVKQVQMLHWWTSGGEAAALNVLKKDLDDEGFTWKDVPVSGGGGDAAMTALKAMVAAGNYPTASQMLGYTVLDYAQAGKMGDISNVAKKENWDQVVPAALQKFAKYDGKWVAVPVNVHSVNWLWINKAVLDKIGGTEPKTMDELFALLDKAKAAGVTPLALGGQNWQEATMFDSVVEATGGKDFYKKAMNDLDDASLKSDTMKKAFDNLQKLVTYVDPNFSGRDWNLATAMVIKGDALVQVMGDWAKGEFKAAGKVAGTDFLCPRFPGTDGSVIYNSDMFGMFDVPKDRTAAQDALAQATLSKTFQVAFNVVKGSVPARTDVSDEQFDMCGKKGIADLKAASSGGTLFGSLAQGYGAPPAVANAYKDVVTKFVHGQIKSSDEPLKPLLPARQAGGGGGARTSAPQPAGRLSPASDGARCGRRAPTVRTSSRAPARQLMSSVATTRPELVEARRAPPRPTMRSRLDEAVPKLVLAPSFISTLVFVYGFIAWTIYLSFTNSKAFPSSVITGTRAYERLWRWTLESDPPSSWYTSITNMAIFGVLYIGLSLAIGLLLAILIDQGIRGESVLRPIYLYPMALSFIVTGVAWKWFLDPGLGLEQTLHHWGWTSFHFDWIKNKDRVIYTVVIAGVWQASGFVMAMFLAGLRGVDGEIVKAAQIDGASAVQIYRRIVIPLLRPIFLSAFIVLAHLAIKSYDLVVALTSGGPGGSAWLPSNFMYEYTFKRNEMAVGSASAVIMLIAISAIIVPYLWSELRERVR